MVSLASPSPTPTSPTPTSPALGAVRADRTRTRPSSTARARVAGPVAAVGLALMLSGCSAANPITTDLDYNASDGVRAVVGSVQVENLIVLTAEQGGPGTLLGAISNEGREDLTVSVGLVDGGGDLTTFALSAEETVLLGPENPEQVEFESVPEPPGALVALLVRSDREGDLLVEVPVLDSTLPEYAELVPDAD